MRAISTNKDFVILNKELSLIRHFMFAAICALMTFIVCIVKHKYLDLYKDLYKHILLL